MSEMQTIEREPFLHRLQSVSAGLASKETIEQSTCFVFKSGQVFTYEEEIACHCPSLLDKSFTAAVRGEKLVGHLQKLTEAKVKVYIKNGKFHVRGKGRGSQYNMEEKISLPLDDVEIPKTWRTLPEHFATAIETVHRCARKKTSEDNRFDLTCVHIHPKWIEACDAFQMCRWNMETGFSEDIMVRQNAIKHIVPLGMTGVCETNSWVHFRNPQEKLVLSCRRFLPSPAPYPDLTEILNVSGRTVVLPKGLIGGAELAQDFTTENPDNDRVRISLTKGRLRLFGKGVTAAYWENRKIDYDGPEMAFFVSTNTLKDLLQDHSKFTISKTKLKVQGSKHDYAFVALLFVPKKKEVGDGKRQKGNQDE